MYFSTSDNRLCSLGSEPVGSDSSTQENPEETLPQHTTRTLATIQAMNTAFICTDIDGVSIVQLTDTVKGIYKSARSAPVLATVLEKATTANILGSLNLMYSVQTSAATA